jgi:hypothetical protein
MRRKLSVIVFFTLLIASFTFSFLSPSLLGLPRTGLNAQPGPGTGTGQPGTGTGQPGPGTGSLPTMIYRKSALPNIADNIDDAQAKGKPDVLTRITDGKKIRQNRRAACRKVRPRRGFSCDEYPFASTAQGGVGASVRLVPVQEQNIQGGIISSFYRVKAIGNGDKFRVSVEP